MKITREAQRAVDFARLSEITGIDPLPLAELCTASKLYTLGAVRACSVPDYSTDRQERALRSAARAAGVDGVTFPGLVPEFRKGLLVFSAIHFGE